MGNTKILCGVIVLTLIIGSLTIVIGGKPKSENTSDNMDMRAPVFPGYSPQIHEMINKSKNSNLYNYVYSLQNFSTRKTGTDGLEESAVWIYNQFKSFGLHAEMQNFTYNGHDISNVIGTLNGSNPDKVEDTYIISGHYDSTSSTDGYAPGADDDASGVALTIEAARIMSQYSFNKTIKFCAWTAEEQGLIGSEHYVNNIDTSVENVEGMFQYDMIGYADPGLNLTIHADTQSNWMLDYYSAVDSSYGLPLNLTLQYDSTETRSDHSSFWDGGYNASMTIETVFSPYYHTSDDLIDYMTMPLVTNDTKLAVAITAHLAELVSPNIVNIDLPSDGDSSGWHFISTRYIPADKSLASVLNDPDHGIKGNYDKALYYGGQTYETIYETYFVDGFETDTGWTFSGGEWERNAPLGLTGDDSYGKADPSSAYNGTDVLGYDLTSNGDYAEGISSTYWAESPSMDMSGRENVTLRFERWLGVQGNGYDHAYIEVYDGSSWVQIWENPDYTMYGDSWDHVSYDVSTWADGNANFQVRFGMGTTNSGSWMEDGKQYCGWNIDDFSLTGRAELKIDLPAGWKSYVPGRTDIYNSFDEISQEIGFWVHMNNSDTLTIHGQIPLSTKIYLDPGWNMVGYPSNITGNNKLPSEIDRIGYYDSGGPYNLAYDYDPKNFSFTPGDAYWLHNPTDEGLVWNVDY